MPACRQKAAELVGYPFAATVPEGGENACIALLGRVYRTSASESLADHEYAPAALPGVYWSYVAWAVHNDQERPVGVMMQITDSSDALRTREEAVLVSEALLLYGLTHHELADALREREQAVSRNKALQRSLPEQNELTSGLNIRLQRSMQETHHRVKNNLQIVNALAEIQMDGVGDTVPTSALQRIGSHVRTLAALHDMLTQQVKNNDAIVAISTIDTFGRLLPLLQGSIGARRIYSDIEDILFSIGSSSSLSLLVSELVSNAVKHGAGDIRVTLRREADSIHLAVADEGRGFPEGFDPRKSANTGIELILSLAQHDLRGEIRFENRGEGGARVSIVFPPPI